MNDPKLQALVARFLVGCVLAELPILVVLLNMTNPDWRYCAAALIGGLVTYLDKARSPQLADVYLPARANSPMITPVVALIPPVPPVPPATII